MQTTAHEILADLEARGFTASIGPSGHTVEPRERLTTADRLALERYATEIERILAVRRLGEPKAKKRARIRRQSAGSFSGGTAESSEPGKLSEQVAPDPAHDRGCWRCGAAPVPPDLDTQVEILRGAHRGRGEIFDWPEAHWTRLRALLRDGDVLIVIKNVFQMLDPNYGAAYVERDGAIVKIDRRDLMEG